jgi:hypothetical protein
MTIRPTYTLGRRSALAALLATLAAPGGLVGAAPHAGGGAGVSRLGISAGAAIEDVPLGTTGPALAPHISILFQTAARLGVRVETVSVGQGFFADEGELLSEHDLDLLVTGRRQDVNTLGAILGRAWEQSAVFIWHPVSATDEETMATATIPLPGGAEALTDATYAALLAELADGGHVRYAGRESLLFVANTGDEPDAAFGARMERVRRILAQGGVPSGAVALGRATMFVADRDSYEALIAA